MLLRRVNCLFSALFSVSVSKTLFLRLPCKQVNFPKDWPQMQKRLSLCHIRRLEAMDLGAKGVKVTSWDANRFFGPHCPLRDNAKFIKYINVLFLYYTLN